MRHRTRRLRRLRRRWGELYPYLIGRVSLQWVKDNFVVQRWPISRIRADPRYPHATPLVLQLLALRRS